MNKKVEKPFILWFSLSAFFYLSVLIKDMVGNPGAYDELPVIIAMALSGLILTILSWLVVKKIYSVIYPGKTMSIKDTLIVWLVMFTITAVLRLT